MAGFSPIVPDPIASRAFYQKALGLPLKTVEGDCIVVDGFEGSKQRESGQARRTLGSEGSSQLMPFEGVGFNGRAETPPVPGRLAVPTTVGPGGAERRTMPRTE